MAEDHSQDETLTAPDPALAHTEIADRTPPGTHTRAAELTRGQRVGRYVVLERLGEGGMGIVYKAQDPELGRMVALKLLHVRAATGSSTAGRSRLLREAQALARLSHPNVVTVHDVGSHESDVFIAMEFVSGLTLSKWLRARTRTVEETLDVFVAAGRGLAAAHAAGLIHRDFKPGNVLIGNDGRVRVADFGLARAANSDEHPPTHDGVPPDREALPLDETVTGIGVVLGTPAYMAPEQLRAEHSDERSDQFSFCVALYEALYGKRPYQGASVEELARTVGHEPLPPPPADARVPARLWPIVRRGLAGDRTERYPSMAALLRDLERASSGGRARWIAVGAVIAVAAAAVLAAALTRPAAATCAGARDQIAQVWNGDVRAAIGNAFASSGRPYAGKAAERTTAAIESYADAWARQRTAACRATRVESSQSEHLMDLRMHCLDQRLSALKALTTLFASGTDPSLVDDALTSVSALPRLEPCADAERLLARVPPPEDPATRRRVSQLMARIDDARALRSAGQYDDAAKIAAQVAEESKSIDHAPLRAAALHERGVLEGELGELDAGEKTLRAAAEVAAKARDDQLLARIWIDLLHHVGVRRWGTDVESLIDITNAAVARAGGDPALRAEADVTIGEVLMLLGKFDDARTHLHRALTAREELYGAQALALVGPLLILAENERRHSDFAASHAALDRAAPIVERELGAEHPKMAVYLERGGSLAWSEGRLDDALRMRERSLELLVSAFGEAHMKVGVSLNNIGDIYWDRADYDTARSYYQRAYDSWLRALGPDDPRLGLALSNLGDSARMQGKLDEALQYHERALALRERLLSPEHPEVAFSLRNLAVVHRAKGQLDRATPLLERALRIQEESKGPTHPSVAAALDTLGNVYLLGGEPKRALEAFERATQIREHRLGERHTDTAISVLNQGEAQQQLGDWRGALERYRSALDVWEETVGEKHPYIAYACTGIGEALLLGGKPADALPYLERAMALRDAQPTEPAEMARTRFALAQVLWKLRRDRDRARELAQAAIADLEKAGGIHAARGDEIREWLRAHGH